MDEIQPTLQVEPFSPREVEILRLLKEGLTNQEIAQALLISLKTVKWYNMQIFAKLGVNNRTRAVERARQNGLLESNPVSPGRETTRLASNLPAPLSSFIGRKTELAGLTGLLRSGSFRLVTLTGPGGVGKTSTAIQVGWKLKNDFKDGVFFVALAATQEAGLVIPTLAAAFGLHEVSGRPPAELLKRYLADRCILLILDNFEQVIEAGPQVCDLLQAAPGVKALVTSREVLRLNGEHVFPLEPLSIPNIGKVFSLQEILNNEAVQLFVARAQALRPDFCLTVENAQAVMEICCHLDGLPLAIELAAARNRLLKPQEMLEQLDHRLGLLVVGMRDQPARQQTMRASIEWSHALLSLAEQVLFRRMAVFSGGCRLETAQAVCGEAGLELACGVESLLDKHLLRSTEAGGETRLGMFETVREFALECLDWSGEGPGIHSKHAEYFANWADQHFHELKLLDSEIENLRAAMRWTIDAEQFDPFLKLIANSWFWSKRIVEIQTWQNELMASQSVQNSPFLKLISVWGAFFEAIYIEDYQKCQEYADQYLALVTAHHYEQSIKIQWRYLAGYVCIGRGDYEGAAEAFSEGLAASQDAEDLFWIGFFKYALGVSLLLLHGYEAAESDLLESIEVFSKIQFKVVLSDVLACLGYVMLEKKDLLHAREYLAEASDQAVRVGFEGGLPDMLNGLAAMAVQQGQWARAARLYGASDELSNRTGCLTHEPPLRIISQRYQAEMRLQLDPAILESSRQEGRRMATEQALAYGLAET